MENQRKMFPDSDPKPKFEFGIERDEERGRVHMRDGADVWTFVLVDGRLERTWKPSRELPEERYRAMTEQAAAILRDMKVKRDRQNTADAQKDIDFSS